MADDLFTTRQNLAEICTVPDKIISVYSLEKHVWADSNSEASRKARKPELQTIEEFKQLAENEAKRPEPTAAHVAKAFERFLRANLTGKGILVLSNLEMLFAYHIELNLLRTMAADEDRVLLLLPGRRSRGRIIMFHEMDEGDYTLPTNLIAENHLWEIRE